MFLQTLYYVLAETRGKSQSSSIYSPEKTSKGFNIQVKTETMLDTENILFSLDINGPMDKIKCIYNTAV